MSTDDCAVDAGTHSAAQLVPLQEAPPQVPIPLGSEGARAHRLERSPEDQKTPGLLAVDGKYRSDWCRYEAIPAHSAGHVVSWHCT
jgi:hypothetical protein